jgi:hypothetical protein
VNTSKSINTLMFAYPNSGINYYNSVGLIYDDFVCINKKDCLVRLEFNLIRNIHFKKEKALTSNYFLLVTGLLLFVSLILTDKIIPLDYKIMAYATSVILLILAFLVKFNNYKIIITTINSNIITTSINPEYKEEGLELVKRIKNNINHANLFIRAI